MTLKPLFVATALISLIYISSSLSVWAVNPPLKTGLDVKTMQQIEVNGVKIENFAGNVNIKSTGTGKAVKVSLKGSDDLLSQVLVADDHGADKGSLYIAFKKDAPTLEDVNKLTLDLEMPATMALDVSLVGGKADIGPRDTNETKISLNGFGDIRVASLKRLESHIDGSGEITVKEIQGDATLAIRGDGKYTIEKGSISTLKASIQGTGMIAISADVKDADLKSEGAGTMNLATVTGKLTQSMSGAGAISISKIEGSMKNSVSGSGQLEMNCASKKK